MQVHQTELFHNIVSSATAIRVTWHHLKSIDLNNLLQ